MLMQNFLKHFFLPILCVAIPCTGEVSQTHKSTKASNAKKDSAVLIKKGTPKSFSKTEEIDSMLISPKESSNDFSLDSTDHLFSEKHQNVDADFLDTSGGSFDTLVQSKKADN